MAAVSTTFPLREPFDEDSRDSMDSFYGDITTCLAVWGQSARFSGPQYTVDEDACEKSSMYADLMEALDSEEWEEWEESEIEAAAGSEGEESEDGGSEGIWLVGE